MENFCSQSFKDPSDRFKDFINSENNDGLTALHFAAYKGNFKAMELLCNQGADYTRQTKSGQNVLHLAAQGGMV
jgi:ankyrin repeat protein